MALSPPRTDTAFTSGRTLAWGVIAMLALAMVLDLVLMVIDALLIPQIGPVRAGISIQRRDYYLTLQGLMFISAAGLFALTGVAFMVWLHGAYANLAALGVQRRYPPMWPIVGFLVPGLNLLRPFEIVHEVWHGSAPGLGARPPMAATLVPWWWALFILATFGATVSALPIHRTVELQEFIVWLNLISNGLMVADAALAVTLVLEITGRQEKKYQQMAAPPPAAGRWRHLETIDGSGAAGDVELAVVSGADTGKVFPLIGAEIVIGRQDRTGTPPWGAIAVMEPSVSRVHAVLNWNVARNVYTIQHKSKTNLTVLNGRPIGEAEVPLAPGDHIRMGRLEMVVRLRERGKAAAAPPPSAAPLAPEGDAPTTVPLREGDLRGLLPQGLADAPPGETIVFPWTAPAPAPPPVRPEPVSLRPEPPTPAAGGDLLLQAMSSSAADAAMEMVTPPALAGLGESEPVAEEPPPPPAAVEPTLDPWAVLRREITDSSADETPVPAATPAERNEEAESTLRVLLGAPAPSAPPREAPAEPVPAPDPVAPPVAAEASPSPALAPPAKVPPTLELKPRKTPRAPEMMETQVDAPGPLPPGGRSLFGLADVSPSPKPPRILPHPVPAATTTRSSTPGLVPPRDTRNANPPPVDRLRPSIPIIPAPTSAGARPPESAPATPLRPNAGPRAFYVPGAQLLHLARNAEPLESRLALLAVQGEQNGARIPLNRTAHLLGRRSREGEAGDEARIELDDPYLPREHAVLLWDGQAGGYRLHLLEESLVTTRVLRTAAGDERSYLITFRQPFLLEPADEIVAGDCRMRLSAEYSR